MVDGIAVAACGGMDLAASAIARYEISALATRFSHERLGRTKHSGHYGAQVP